MPQNQVTTGESPRVSSLMSQKLLYLWARKERERKDAVLVYQALKELDDAHKHWWVHILSLSWQIQIWFLPETSSQKHPESMSHKITSQGPETNGTQWRFPADSQGLVYLAQGMWWILGWRDLSQEAQLPQKMLVMMHTQHMVFRWD